MYKYVEHAYHYAKLPVHPSLSGPVHGVIPWPDLANIVLNYLETIDFAKFEKAILIASVKVTAHISDESVKNELRMKLGGEIEHYNHLTLYWSLDRMPYWIYHLSVLERESTRQMCHRFMCFKLSCLCHEPLTRDRLYMWAGLRLIV